MGAETSQKRNDACRGMLDYGFANFAHYTPSLPEPVAVPVELGKAEQVTVILPDAAPMLVKKGELSAITARTELPEGLDAPVEQGQQLGELVLEREGERIAALPLTAGEDVPRLTWPDLFARLLSRVAMGGAGS
jgi:D-alanyl-D-alanine carboxypeptidase (penicillin-binding protein 5/6)